MLYKALPGKEEQIVSKCEIKEILATDFNKFFISKVGNIIASIQAAECPEILPLTNNHFWALTLLSLSDIKKLLTASTTSTSTLDRITTRIVKSFSSEFSSIVLNEIIFSLEKGVFPTLLNKQLLNLTLKMLILILRSLQTIGQYQTSVTHQSY